MFIHHVWVFKQNAVLEVCNIALPVSSKDVGKKSALLAWKSAGINGPLTKLQKPQLAQAV